MYKLSYVVWIGNNILVFVFIISAFVCIALWNCTTTIKSKKKKKNCLFARILWFIPMIEYIETGTNTHIFCYQLKDYIFNYQTASKLLGATPDFTCKITIGWFEIRIDLINCNTLLAFGTLNGNSNQNSFLTQIELKNRWNKCFYRI